MSRKLIPQPLYPAMFIEGGDSVGKNDLVRSIAKYLVITEPNRKILLMNFPQFWFFAHDTRLMTRGVCADVFDEMTGIEEARVRGTMYALDRSIALLLVENILAEDPSIIVLSDRGPYSSCVTTGYIWANKKITKEEVESQIAPKLFHDVDQGLFSFFKVNSLLCKVQNGFADSGIAKRKALDDYESELPQKHSYETYKLLNLPEIITKNDNGWRPRLDLVHEALEKLHFSDVKQMPLTNSLFDDDEILIEAHKKGKLLLVGPEMLLEHFKMKSKIDNNLKKMIVRWTRLSLDGADINNRDRKEILDDLETKIALRLKQLAPHFNYHSGVRPMVARKAISRLLRNNPAVYDILRRTSGNKLINFLHALLSEEQLRFLQDRP